MELKHANEIIEAAKVASFNRTFMELKRTCNSLSLPFVGF